MGLLTSWKWWIELYMIKHGSECGILRNTTLSSMNQPKGRDETLSPFIRSIKGPWSLQSFWWWTASIPGLLVAKRTSNDSCIHQNKSLVSLNLTLRQNLPLNCCFNVSFRKVYRGLQESSPYWTYILERIRNEMMFGKWNDECRKVAFSFFFFHIFSADLWIISSGMFLGIMLTKAVIKTIEP